MSMANFYIVNALGQNLATQWPNSSELKIKFDPSLDSSLCELFKIIKKLGPKIHPWGVIWVQSTSPHAGHLPEK